MTPRADFQIRGLIGAACVVLSGCPRPPVTYHQDAQRTGWNRNEPTLAPPNVQPGKFGLIAHADLDDEVDTQPLVVPNQTIAGAGTHTVVYVATEGNSVYALDGYTGAVLKMVNLGPPVPMQDLPTSSGTECTNNGPNVGINGTPTIDVQNQTFYAIAYVLGAGGAPQYWLHALDLSSLAEKRGSPQLVSANHIWSDGTSHPFEASIQRQRAALLQANGNVYAAFGSFCDFSPENPDSSRGWVLGWHARTLAPLPANVLTDSLAMSPGATGWNGVYYTSFFLGSVWMSGYGLAADVNGNIYFVTGNGNPATYGSPSSIQESVIKVRPDLAGPPLDLFTPSDWSQNDLGDNDFGSGGVLLLPDQPAPVRHIAVAAGKDGRMFVLNRENLGGLHTPDLPPNVNIGSCWCGPSYFRGADGVGRVVTSGGQQVMQWRVNPGSPPTLVLEASATLQSSGQDGGFFTSVSSGRSGENAIIWALGRPVGADNHITLYAFSATPAGAMLPLLWSSIAGSWPYTGGNANLVPTVSGGRVYVASYKKLAIFGPVAP